MRHIPGLVALALLGCLFVASPAGAWSHSPVGGGVPLSSSTGNCSAPVPDGSGGCYVAFQRYSGGYDIYAQHVDASGALLWGSGVAVATGAGDQALPILASDGQGGCEILWRDTRNDVAGGTYDVYAQRLSSAGVALWTANGVPICTASGNQYPLQIVDDRSGGAWICWNDLRTGGFVGYLQHVSSAGAMTGAANGVAVVALASSSYNPSIACDSFGYATVAWTDYRAGTTDIYAQRYAPAVTALWGVNGVAVCATAGNQYDPQVRFFGDNTAAVVWSDFRGADSDIYAQRLNTSSGASLWAANGVAICTAAGSQSTPILTLDPLGYIVTLWQDARSGSTTLFAQRIDANGQAMWASNGDLVRPGSGAANSPTLVSDGISGTLVSWSDTRNDVADVWAQRVSPSGTLMWSTNGVPGTVVESGINIEANYGICPTPGGGAFVTTNDGTSFLARVQAIDEWGYLGAEPLMAGVKDIPNDQGGQVKVSWYASPLDTDPLYRNITDYVVYRSAPAHLAATLARVATRDGATYGGKRYLRTRTSAQDYFWEELAHVTPRHLSGYSYAAATTGDSVAGSNPRTAFMVMAIANYGSSWWTCNPDSGYSVDNLPPATPAPLTGQYGAGRVALHWDPNTDADVAGYRVYRGATPGFVIGAASLISAQADTGLVDLSAAPAYYKVTAFDTHGNESAPATLLPAGTLAVDDAPLHASFATPAPNPIRGGGASLLRFAIAQAGRVSLGLYDAQGRFVRSLLDGVLEAGVHAVRFDGRDDGGRALAPGLYLARLSAPGLTGTRRLVLTE